MFFNLLIIEIAHNLIIIQAIKSLEICLNIKVLDVSLMPAALFFTLVAFDELKSNSEKSKRTLQNNTDVN